MARSSGGSLPAGRRSPACVAHSGAITAVPCRRAASSGATLRVQRFARGSAGSPSIARGKRVHPGNTVGCANRLHPHKQCAAGESGSTRGARPPGRQRHDCRRLRLGMDVRLSRDARAVPTLAACVAVVNLVINLSSNRRPSGVSCDGAIVRSFSRYKSDVARQEISGLT